MPEDFTQYWPLNWQRLHLNNLLWQKIMLGEVGCYSKCHSAAPLLGEISCLLDLDFVFHSKKYNIDSLQTTIFHFYQFFLSNLTPVEVQKASDWLSSYTAVERELKCYPLLRFALYISGGLKRLRDQYEIFSPSPLHIILFKLPLPRQTLHRQSTPLIRTDMRAGKLRGSDSGRLMPWED